MPAEVRRRAKAINFGIIYGISAFGLANQLGIAREEAGATSRNISSASPASATTWSDAAQGARDGYVSTLFGRKMHFPRSARRTRRSGPSSTARRSTRRCRAPPPTSSAAP
jgi:DNA polymerase-1